MKFNRPISIPILDTTFSPIMRLIYGIVCHIDLALSLISLHASWNSAGTQLGY